MSRMKDICQRVIVGVFALTVTSFVLGCAEPDYYDNLSERDKLLLKADSIMEVAVDVDSALSVLERAKELSVGSRELAEVELAEALVYFGIGDEIMSKQLLNRSLVCYDTLRSVDVDDCQNRAKALSLYAELMSMCGNQNEALRAYMRVIPLSRTIGDMESYKRSRMYISDVESMQGNYMSALEGYLDVLPYVTNDDRFRVYTALQKTYYAIGDFMESERYLSLMRQEVEEEDIYGNCVVLFAELEYYNIMENMSKVTKCIAEIKKYSKIPELSSYYELHICSALTDYYLGQDNRDSAMVFVSKLMMKPKSEHTEIELYRNLVMVRWCLYNGEYGEAKRMLSQVKANDYKRSSLSLYNKYMTLLADYYILQGNDKKGYEVKMAFDHYNDSLRNETISHNMAYKMLSLRRDTTILSQKVAMAKSKEAIDRLYFMQSFWLFFTILVVLVVLVGYLGIHMKKVKNRYLKMEEMNDTLQFEVMRQTNILRLQSEELRQKNEGLRSEIVYASKLQQDILPDESRLDIPFISDHFIIHKPCDMISGDFYWIGSINNKLLVCCGDATGHGIPGTFVAMVCTTILNELLYTSEDKTALGLINGLNRNLGRVLQNNEDAHIDDSVDLSMLCVDTVTGETTAVLARHKLYVIDVDGKVSTVSGVKRSIGDTDVKITQREFEEVKVELKDGDMVYMTTDGCESQFGGPMNTKLKRRNMLEWFVHVYDKPLEKQKGELDALFETWKGSNEQTDDVLIIGLRFKYS